MIQFAAYTRTDPIPPLRGPKELTGRCAWDSGGPSQGGSGFAALTTTVDVAVDILEVLTTFTYLPHISGSLLTRPTAKPMNDPANNTDWASTETGPITFMHGL